MRLVIALDHSEYAEIVLEHGLDEANRRQADEVHVVTVVRPDEPVEAGRARLETLLRDAIDAFRVAGRVILHALHGDPVDALSAFVRQLAPDVLVIGRFHAPTLSDELVARLEVPMLVVGLEGPVLEPQCPACVQVRRESDGEQLFCAAHVSDREPALTTRIPSSTYIPSRMW